MLTGLLALRSMLNPATFAAIGCLKSEPIKTLSVNAPVRTARYGSRRPS